MKLDYFPFFDSYLTKTKNLSDSELGRLVRACSRYNASGQREELNGRESIAYDFIADDIDRAKANYNAKCETNKRNREQRPSTTVNDRQRPSTTAYEIDNTNTNTNTFKSSPNGDDRSAGAPADARTNIIKAWNELPEGISRVSRIVNGSQRLKHLDKRLRDYSEQEIIKAIDNIKQSAFLQGNNDRGWVITFDWFIRPENFQKVLDGNYNDKQKKQSRPREEWEQNRSYDLESAIEKAKYTVPTLRKKE